MSGPDTRAVLQVTVAGDPDTVTTLTAALASGQVVMTFAPMPEPAPDQAARAESEPIVAHRWYDIEFLAIHYGLPASTLREMAAAGVLPGNKIGRNWKFYGADLLAHDAALRAGARRR